MSLTVAVASVLLAIMAVPAPARAQGDPKMALEDIPLDLGALRSFADVATARLHCPGDVVVWPDTGTGYFHSPGEKRFGVATGGFACKREALGAGYWDSNPFAGEVRRDRAFPIDPALRPDYGS